ncbi:HIT family protein [Candidatus Kaiserbacteria bacterium]|nr:HIT family protein [Candidatus Kaiserbacteria bacterium]
MSSIFSKIINRELPGFFIYEDDVCVAILDISPAVPGQTLIIPKQEVDYIGRLDEDTYLHLMKISRKIAKALDQTFSTLRTCYVIEGFEVPHVHIKLYPMTSDEIPLGKILPSGQMAESDELEKIVSAIKANL